MDTNRPEGIEFSKNGVLFLLVPEIRPYCGPLYFSRSLNFAAGNIITNGSFGLVNTGLKKLLVTCYHVWAEFKKLQAEDPNLKIHICLDQGSPVVLQAEPIDQDARLDIATFDMESLLSACSGRKFYPLEQNPPRPVVSGDRIFLIGYPGVFRSATVESVQFGRTPYALSVSDSSADGLRFSADISKAIYEESQLQDKHGGISGSPCFLIRQGWPAQLVGFTSEDCMSILWFTHARCLNRDGTISRRLA
jgi:hypothetical protein